MDIKVTNRNTGLSKVIETEGYTLADYLKTFEAYLNSGYGIEIVKAERPLRPLCAGVYHKGMRISAADSRMFIQEEKRSRILWFDSVFELAEGFKEVKEAALK